MRTEALQQPTLPTMLKEIHSRTQSSSSLFRSCEHPSPVVPHSTITTDICSPAPADGVLPWDHELLLWPPEGGHCSAVTWAGSPLPLVLHVLLPPQRQELQMGSNPSTNPTVQAPEFVDGCSDTELRFLCWQALASFFFPMERS